MCSYLSGCTRASWLPKIAEHPESKLLRKHEPDTAHWRWRLFSWREARAQRSRNVRKNVDMITRFGCGNSGYEALTITMKGGFRLRLVPLQARRG
jgi:hypothetical protein